LRSGVGAGLRYNRGYLFLVPVGVGIAAAGVLLVDACPTEGSLGVQVDKVGDGRAVLLQHVLLRERLATATYR
jgi:hypothetical protein